MKTPLPLAPTFPAAPTAFVAVDRDGNGLSDLYEFIYLGAPALPSDPPDDDGHGNAEEMIRGTAPTQQGSRTTGATALIEGDELFLAWPRADGKW